MKQTIPRLGFAIFAASAVSATAATTFYDANVTNAVIFGSGNTNGFFTVSRETNGLEIGLRAKQRFPSPAGIYNSNGDGTYTFPAGAATSGAGWIDSNTPVWSFDWSINTNWNGSGGNIGTGTFAFLSLDIDPSSGTNFQPFEILQGPDHHSPPNAAWDHSFGTNSTPDNSGAKALNNPATYASLLANNNLVQNSWNYEFFDSSSDFFGISNPLLASFVPVNGEYEIKLEVFDAASGGNLLGSNSIKVMMIPEPTLAFGGLLCLSGLFFRRRDR